MDKLKDFIDNNRDEFDLGELPAGHLERFEKKLALSHNKRPLRYTLYSLVVAASVGLILLFNVTHLMDDPLLLRGEVCETREEFEELRLYYHMQINEVLAQMESLYQENQVPGGEELLQASAQVISENNRFENIVVPELPCSTDGLFALNQHYSNSLESLHIMLKHLQYTIEETNH